DEMHPNNLELTFLPFGWELISCFLITAATGITVDLHYEIDNELCSAS
ncbi:10514_t:CDS:1, partial [Ambispora leptoticha]